RELDFRQTPTDNDAIIPPMLPLLVIAFALIAHGVQASPECMTKQEARAKWPTKPVYSHGSSSCWNDQPLSGRRSTTLPGNTSDSTTRVHALGLSAASLKATKTEVFFPSNIANNSVSTDLFNGTPMTNWVVIDIDLPDPNNGIDRC